MSYATNVVQSQCLSIISINIYHSFSMYNVVEWLTPVGKVLRAEMASYVQKGKSQLLVKESNITRMVIKIRLIVESVNGRLKL